MKSFYKIITLALFMLGLFSVSGNVWAEEEKVEILYENKAELVATVNIYGAKILSQKNNIFDISFVLSNGKIMQPGVKYSVLLIKNIDKGQVVVDQKVYEEVVDLPVNTSITKNINYIAPSNLEGKFTLYLQSKNDKGMTFSTTFVKEIELKAENTGLNIFNETCYLRVVEENKDNKYSINQGVDILENESIKLFCMAENKSDKSISVTPNFETFYRSMYGNKVEQVGGETEPIIFNSGENKEIYLTLPKATMPQAYDVKVGLNNDQIKSNSVIVHYVLKGPSATIQNLSLDKDYYQKDEKIEISFLWSASADSFPGARYNNENKVRTYAEINVVNRSGRNCIEKPLFKELPLDFSNPKILYSEVSKIDCIDPSVSVSLVDSDGKIFDQKSFDFETKTEVPFKFDWKNITLIIVLALVMMFVLIRKKKNMNSSIGVLSFFLGIMILSLGLFSFARNAKADTFIIGGENFWAEVSVSWQGSNGSYFEPDEERPVSGSIKIASCGNPIQAELYTGSTYLIERDPPGEMTYDEGSAILPPNSTIGSSYVRFDALAINNTTKETISGYINLEYVIVGPNECCDSYRNCCTAGVISGFDDTDSDFYKWRCPGVNYPSDNTYPTSEVCTYPKDKSVSCNYLDAWKDHANNVSEYYHEDYAPTAPNDYCKNGTASNISRSFDSFNNQIVSYTCTGADSTSVECSVPLTPPKNQCYSGEINATFYSDLSNCNGDICVDGSPKGCFGGESYGYYYWHCPTGNNYKYPFDHLCNLPYEENQEYLLPDPECNNTSIGHCVNGEPANLNTTDPSNYTWNCLPISGVTTDKTIPTCVVSKSKLIGDLNATPKECFIPFWKWDPVKNSCQIELDWSFFGPNASNVEGKVFLKDATDDIYKAIDSNLSQNGGGVFWTITKDSDIALLSTYKDANSSYSKVIGIANKDTNFNNVRYYVYDIESIKIVKKENQKPIPYVEMENGGPAEIKANTSGEFVIWATDEDPIPENSNHDVSFKIDWNNDGVSDQNIPPMNGNYYTWVKVGEKIKFSSSVDWADTPGEKCFQYKALDYGDQVEGSSWKSFCVKILDPNAPTGTLKAVPNPCYIQENQWTCTTSLTLEVINPVDSAQTNVTKPVDVEVISNATINNVFPKTVSGITVNYPSTTFYLNHKTKTLDDETVYAECDKGLSWDSENEKCVVSTKPDLIIESFNANSNDVSIDTLITFTAVVKNNSSVDVTSKFNNEFKYEGASSSKKQINSLNGGKIFEINDEKTYLTPGTYNVELCIDSDNKIDESNENNNCKNITISVNDGTENDGESTWDVNIWAEPETLIDGRSGKIIWIITREGTGGSCTISSEDKTLGDDGKISATGSDEDPVKPRVPKGEKTKIYNYVVECEGKIKNGSITHASIKVVKLTEIEN